MGVLEGSKGGGSSVLAHHRKAQWDPGCPPLRGGAEYLATEDWH